MQMSKVISKLNPHAKSILHLIRKTFARSSFVLKHEIIERMLSSILVISNDSKSHRCPHSSTCGLTLYRGKPEPR